MHLFRCFRWAELSGRDQEAAAASRRGAGWTAPSKERYRDRPSCRKATAAPRGHQGGRSGPVAQRPQIHARPKALRDEEVVWFEMC